MGTALSRSFLAAKMGHVNVRAALYAVSSDIEGAPSVTRGGDPVPA
jgi:hypothetical protein